MNCTVSYQIFIVWESCVDQNPRSYQQVNQESDVKELACKAMETPLVSLLPEETGVWKLSVLNYKVEQITDSGLKPSQILQTWKKTHLEKQLLATISTMYTEVKKSTLSN
ncbi:hypothetical protein VP01_7100g1 [Puccinia sorghi]|uniref:Uncharacterized protein n=1 Tax=Puccinia sorghi TaxID=27349 RepID=A0A0L6UEE3_9BASI|nr:hypothetical protein VP01_7100g1 [Puccinia sorghi]